MSQTEFSIEIDLGENKRTFHLTNVKELEEWLTEEKVFLTGQLSPSSFSEENQKDFIERLQNPIEICLKSLNEKIKEGSTDKEFKDGINHIQRVLNKHYRNKKVPHSSSREGAFIKTLKEKSPKETIIGFAYFMNTLGSVFPYESHWRNSSRFVRQFIEVVNRAALFDKGLDGNVFPERKAFDSLIREYENKNKDLERDLSKSHEELENIQATHEKKKNNLEELEKLYREQLALKAPVQYWKDKAKNHFYWFLGFAFGVLISGVLAAVFLIYSSSKFLTSETPSPSEIGFFIIVVTLIIWALRILIRIMLSQLHLSNDANERAVMIETYLSIMNEKETDIDKEDRAILLQAIFRPSTNGLIRDDGIPPSVYALLTKFGGSK